MSALLHLHRQISQEFLHIFPVQRSSRFVHSPSHVDDHDGSNDENTPPSLDNDIEIVNQSNVQVCTNAPVGELSDAMPVALPSNLLEGNSHSSPDDTSSTCEDPNADSSELFTDRRFISKALPIILFVGVFAYIGNTIHALETMSYTERREKCPQSHIWLYLLVNMMSCLILSFYFLIGSVWRVREKIQTNLFFFTRKFIHAGLVVWGCYELWGVSCVDSITHTTLYDMAYAHVIINIITFLFLLFFMYIQATIES